MIEYFEKTIDVLKNSLSCIDEKIYNKLVCECETVLKNGGKIIASGLGKNAPICEKFVGTMISFGFDARFLHTNTALHGDIGMVTEKDLVFVFSKSGKTEESISLTQHLLKRGCQIWLISCADKSPLTEMIKNKIIIPLETEGDAWNISPNNSATLYLILLQALAIELNKKFNIKLEEYKKNHPGGGIGKQLKQIG